MNTKNSSLFMFLLLLVAVTVAFSVTSEHFATLTNAMKALKHLSIIAISALGLTYVIVVGKSDMSFHYVSCFGAMTMSYVIGIGGHPVLAILSGLSAAAAVGCVNGYLIGRLKLPDMVATIGIGSAIYGIAYIYSGGRFIYRNFLDSGIMQINNYEIFDILPLPVVIMALLYIASWFVLHKTTIGRNFYAVGGNPVAAKFSGINVAKYIFMAFIVCAVFASLTNIIQVASQGKGEIKAGIPLLMPSWSAVFVGIAVFKRATVYGTLLGAMLIAMMQNGFTLLSVPFYYMDFIVGITLISSIVIANKEHSYFNLSMFKNMLGSKSTSLKNKQA